MQRKLGYVRVIRRVLQRVLQTREWLEHCTVGAYGLPCRVVIVLIFFKYIYDTNYVISISNVCNCFVCNLESY
jgi:hypothetical protein